MTQTKHTGRGKPPGTRRRISRSRIEEPASPEPKPEERRLDWKRAAALTLLAFVVYNANLRPISVGDCYPARFIPFSLWGRGSLTLDPVRDVARVGQAGPHSFPYWIMSSRQGWTVSSYPIVTPILVAPLYAPAVAVLRLKGWSRDQLAVVAPIMEKLSASLVAAVSVALMFLLLRRRLDRGLSTLLAAGYAFATNTWVTSSQALWQHGTTQLLSLVALLALTAEGGRWRLPLAGAACGLIPFNRPPDLPLALAIGVAALLVARNRAWPFVLAAAASAAPFAALNWHLFGHIGGGYFRMNGISGFFSHPIPLGVAGLLFSPGKGLFVYAPFLVFLAARMRRPAPGDGHRILDACLAAGVALTVVLLASGDISGGFSYGARFLTGALPSLVWLLAPVARSASPAGRRALVVSILLGVLVQAAGAFCYPYGDSVHGNLWSLRDAPFLLEPRAGLAPAEFFARPPGR